MPALLMLAMLTLPAGMTIVLVAVIRDRIRHKKRESFRSSADRRNDR